MAPGEVVRVSCPAKLNLFLEVPGKRADGYHDIETVIVPAPIEDRLEAALASGGGISLDLRLLPGRDDGSVPADETNLAVRAAALVLAEVKSTAGVRLTLHKEIPAGAGLGGGSSDAAGALRAVNRLLGSPVSDARLAELALSLGSDVPYFLRGGAALARGRGEILEPVPCRAGFRFLVVFPRHHVATKDVYARCSPPAVGERRDPRGVLDALAAGDVGALARACFNRLEAPAREVSPEFAASLDLLRNLGLGPVHMTGSGSACFLLLPPGDAALEWIRRLDRGCLLPEPDTWWNG